MMRANDGTRTAAEVLIDQLVIHGVHHMLCVPGESYIAALDACHDRDIAITVCRQESGAAIMAEAQGKATGRPGVCFVTRGPGATNAAAGLHISRSRISRAIWPTNRIRGVESWRAICSPAAALVAPGPRVTKQTPGRPVALPCASAMIAAPLSCRHTVTAMSRSCRASSAAM